MKHQYFGDVNDYVKYGLLRCFSMSGLRLGICWMLTPEDGKSDGRKIHYVTKPNKWKAHDPQLFAHLAETVAASDGRNLRHIESPDWFSGEAKFNGEIVPESSSDRSGWFQSALNQLQGSDLFFFDPDNGIEVPSMPIGRNGSSKYVYWHELEEAWRHAHGLVVFQHFARIERNTYIASRVAEMQSHLEGAKVVPLRSSNVLFLLAYRPSKATEVDKALALTKSRWANRIFQHGIE